MLKEKIVVPLRSIPMEIPSRFVLVGQSKDEWKIDYYGSVHSPCLERGAVAIHNVEDAFNAAYTIQNSWPVEVEISVTEDGLWLGGIFVAGFEFMDEDDIELLNSKEATGYTAFAVALDYLP